MLVFIHVGDCFIRHFNPQKNKFDKMYLKNIDLSRTVSYFVVRSNRSPSIIHFNFTAENPI